MTPVIRVAGRDLILGAVTTNLTAINWTRTATPCPPVVRWEEAAVAVRQAAVPHRAGDPTRFPATNTTGGTQTGQTAGPTRPQGVALGATSVTSGHRTAAV